MKRVTLVIVIIGAVLVVGGCGLAHRMGNSSNAAKVSPGMTKDQILAIMGNPEIFSKATVAGEPVEDYQYWTTWSIEGQTKLYTHFIIKDGKLLGYFEDKYTGPVITTLSDSLGRFGDSLQKAGDTYNRSLQRGGGELRARQNSMQQHPRGVVDENGRWYQVVY